MIIKKEMCRYMQTKTSFIQNNIKTNQPETKKNIHFMVPFLKSSKIGTTYLW